MATTTVLRFSTEGRPSSKPDFLEWAHSNQIDEPNEGTSQEEFERLYDEYYQEKANILSKRGHNTNVDKITRANTIDNDRYRIEQIRHRWDRVQRVQDLIRFPFLLPMLCSWVPLIIRAVITLNAAQRDIVILLLTFRS